MKQPKNQLLLLEDVENIGRSGDLVTVKPGFARNFLLPQQKAILAEKHTIRLREKLQKERAEKAKADKKKAEELSRELKGKVIKTRVKVDQAGHMYGSITAVDVARMANEQLGIEFTRKSVVMPKPIKRLGVHEIALKLNEGVSAQVELEIAAEAL